MVTIVEDERGNADRLALYNQSDTSILSNVPEGCILAIKEPYYRLVAGTGRMICVDHPSDVILLRFNDSIIPDTLRSKIGDIMNKSASEWKAIGDAAFIQQDLPTAIFW